MVKKPPSGLAIGQPHPGALGLAGFWGWPCGRPAGDNSGCVKFGQEASLRVSQWVPIWASAFTMSDRTPGGIFQHLLNISATIVKNNLSQHSLHSRSKVLAGQTEGQVSEKYRRAHSENLFSTDCFLRSERSWRQTRHMAMVFFAFCSVLPLKFGWRDHSGLSLLCHMSWTLEKTKSPTNANYFFLILL